jgi:hypothetical protein
VSEFQTMFLHVSESTGSGTVDTDICVLIQTQIKVSELTQKIVSSFWLPANPLQLGFINDTDSLIVARGPKTLSPYPPWSSPPQELPNGTQPQRSKNLNSFQHNVNVMGMPRLHHGERKRAWTVVHHVCDPATTAPQ